MAGTNSLEAHRHCVRGLAVRASQAVSENLNGVPALLCVMQERKRRQVHTWRDYGGWSNEKPCRCSDTGIPNSSDQFVFRCDDVDGGCNRPRQSIMWGRRVSQPTHAHIITGTALRFMGDTQFGNLASNEIRPVSADQVQVRRHLHGAYTYILFAEPGTTPSNFFQERDLQRCRILRYAWSYSCIGSRTAVGCFPPETFVLYRERFSFTIASCSLAA